MLATWAFALLLGSGPVLAADPVFDAMALELHRSLGHLRNAEKTPLYFLEYELTDSIQYNVGASNGALAWESDRSYERFLDVDARVGSRKLDNTHQIKGPPGSETQNYRG